MFASQVKKTIEVVDGADTHSVVIRMLNWKSLEKAAKARSLEQAEGVRAYGGEVVKAIRSEGMEQLAEQVREHQTDPKVRAAARYDSYDQDTVLRAGIESWDSPEKIEKGLDQLKPKVARQIFEAIVDLSDPAEEDAQALGKGDSGASTSS